MDQRGKGEQRWGLDRKMLFRKADRRSLEYIGRSLKGLKRGGKTKGTARGSIPSEKGPPKKEKTKEKECQEEGRGRPTKVGG